MARKKVTNNFKVFPERLSALMKERQTTQQELASALGVKRQTISLYKSGQSIPDAEQLKNIAVFFDVSADWLLGLSQFVAPEQKREANELYDDLLALMAMNGDARNSLRIRRTLIAVVNGFKNALLAGQAFAWYENAIEHTALSLSTAAKCLQLIEAPRYDRKDDRSALFFKLDKIIHEAATTTYTDIGYFFSSCQNELKEAFNILDASCMNLNFLFKFDQLEKELQNNATISRYTQSKEEEPNAEKE